MRLTILVAAVLLAGVVTAQTVSRTYLQASAVTREVHASLLADGGVRIISECEVPIQDGGTGMWSGTLELTGTARTNALTLMDSATVKGACKLR